MTRQASVADIKNRHQHGNAREIPRAGTQRRRIYDWLFANAKGKVAIVDFAALGVTHRTIHSEIYNIGLAYGLDIRVVGNGGPKRMHPMRVILAGEWDGRAYIDFTIYQKGLSL